MTPKQAFCSECEEAIKEGMCKHCSGKLLETGRKRIRELWTEIEEKAEKRVEAAGGRHDNYAQFCIEVVDLARSTLQEMSPLPKPKNMERDENGKN